MPDALIAPEPCQGTVRDTNIMAARTGSVGRQGGMTRQWIVGRETAHSARQVGQQQQGCEQKDV